jgi:hypothetical protein
MCHLTHYLAPPALSRMKRPLTEKAIQAACIDHWRKLGVPGSLVAAVPNANAFGQSGLTCGLFDLVVMSPTLGPKTGWLEIKTATGKLSLDQVRLGELMLELGIPHAVCYGRDQPIEQLRWWGAIR